MIEDAAKLFSREVRRGSRNPVRRAARGAVLEVKELNLWPAMVTSDGAVDAGGTSPHQPSRCGGPWNKRLLASIRVSARVVNSDPPTTRGFEGW
jgi:hypothetical protein